MTAVSAVFLPSAWVNSIDLLRGSSRERLVRGTFLVSMRYSIMVLPNDPRKKIEDIEGLIARAEDRVRKIQARAEPGTERLVRALTNSIRKHRRNLQKLLDRQADPTDQKDQLRQQQRQMQQAQRISPADRSGELPAKQDQEPRKPVSHQGVVADQ